MNEFDLVLPAAVDVREVGMRDGLQLEAPGPAGRQAGDARGAGRHRRAADRGRRRSSRPRRCRRSPTPTRWPPSCPAGRGVHWSALVANPRGAVRAVDAGIADLEYVVSASDSHSRANAGRSTAEAVGRRRRDRRAGARRRRLARGHHRHRLGLPVRRPHPDRPHRRRRPRRGDRRSRPAVPGRHDRDDDAAARGPAARRRPPRLPRRARWACTSTTPAAPARPTRWPRCRPGSPSWTPRSAGSAAARSRPAPAATSPPRSSSTCWRSPASRTGLDLDAVLAAARGHRAGGRATSCPARCTGPAAGRCPGAPRPRG